MAKEEKKTKKPSPNIFPVVGIGASAGGLDAFKKLIKAIPEDSGMAYVLVQHLDPKHESMLPEILQKVTTIPVLEISDDIKVQPNHIYIIPSNKMMVANDGVLELSPRTTKKNERNLPVDLFFTSLAEVHQAHSLGVVLSGTASDGTKGLKAIKDHGGITIAQSEDSAAYDGMPHSAIQAGVVDFILPPEQIPQKLLEITRITNGNGGEVENLPKPEADIFKQILLLLRMRKGTDFTYYKQPTIRRRIFRRMALNKNEDPAMYLKFLREKKEEQDVLYQDLLIPVTSFFRDTKSFDNLCETVLPSLVKNKAPNLPIRVWVAGCSTGQEVFTIAICLKEFLTKTLSREEGEGRGEVQIFATDISEPAIAKARAGIYKKSELDGITPKHLQEYFTKTIDGHQVNKSIRDMCVFAVHNFVKDPPFGKLDLISCRNVLIYMEPYLQKKALTTFHYSLNHHGFLLLGKSETIANVPDLFAIAHKGDKIFSRKDVPGKYMHTATLHSEQGMTDATNKSKDDSDKSGRADYQKTADDIMLTKYTPAGVVVNEAMDIVHFRGKTANYLEQLPGKPSHNLLKMAKNGLAFELRNVLHKTKKDKAPVTKENIPIQVNGTLHTIAIEAMLLPDTIEPHYLILFHERPSGNSAQAGVKRLSKTKKEDKDLLIAQLEKELAQTREDMRSITEDQEAANEELQSANEELLSGSEEMQSLNEELETGKEELQSTNEELSVVNQEMISLNEQITTARDYAEAIIENIREPLLVLDKNLRVQTANDAFYKTFHTHEKETIGALIYDLGNKQWNIAALRTLLENILPEKSTFNDFEVTHTFAFAGERVMLLNAREVINKNSSEKSILLSIEDITGLKKAQKILATSGNYLKQLLKGLPAIVYSCDAKGFVNYYNDEAINVWGRVPELGKERWSGAHKMFMPDGSPLAFHKGPMAIAMKEGRPITSEEIIIERPDGTRRHLLVNPQPEFGLSGEVTGAINMCFDVTDQIIALKKSEASEAKFRSLIEEAPVATCLFVGRELKIAIANEQMIAFWGKDKTVIGKPLGEALPELIDQPYLQLLDDVFTTGKTYSETNAMAKLIVNGMLGTYYFDFTYKPLLDADGNVYGIMDMAVDVTEQVLARKLIEESEQKFKQMAELVPQKVWTADAKGKKNYFNQTLLDYAGMTFDELKDDGWQKIIHPDDWEVNKKLWLESISTGNDYQSENRFLRHDGKYLWHLTRAVAIKDEAGNIKMWIGSKTEIQEQKEHQIGLEKAVIERTHDLVQANVQVEQKNQELVQMNSELQSFTYIASHDLQEPLRKIQTFARRIVEKEHAVLSENGKDYFLRMQQAAGRMQTLIEDLLSFSRVNMGERKYEQTDLTTILDEVKSDFKEIIEEKNAVIETHGLGQAYVIPFQFHQLLQNLLGNALKFTKPNTAPHIVIKSEIAKGSTLHNRLLPEKEYCHITMSDNGIGYEPEFKDKIFELFQQLHGKDKYKGTGIGLSIVKKIVENHNGIVTATGELGIGATFDIYIPNLAKAEAK